MFDYEPLPERDAHLSNGKPFWWCVAAVLAALLLAPLAWLH